MNEGFTGAYPYKNAEVASVPCGSGNDFVRNFGAAEDFLSLADNIAGTAVPVDLVAANGGVSAAICSVGLDSEVAYSIPKYRRLPLCGEIRGTARHIHGVELPAIFFQQWDHILLQKPHQRLAMLGRIGAVRILRQVPELALHRAEHTV